MHPLDLTRHSFANWSDIEIQALKVAIAQAATACAARDPKTFSGDALIDLARLCALGQAWPTVVEATALYIAADTPTKPLLDQAYAAQIDAQLHLKDEPSALNGAEAMLRLVAYDSLVAEAIDECMEYMQFAHTADALTLGTLREPLVLAAIRAAGQALDTAKRPQVPATPPPSPYAPQSIHELYSAGLRFAALQQLAAQPESARSSVAGIDAALPASLAPDDALPIAAARRRYALLGQPLPKIALLATLSMPNTLPQLPAPHAITALLLFPDTCAQCVRMGRQFPESVFIVSNHEAYFYALMAETSAPKPRPLPAAGVPPPKPLARDLLQETPTVLVPLPVLDQFAANDFPFLIIADARGIIRLAQPVDEDALQSGGTLDTAIARVGQQWPAAPPEPSAPQTAVPPRGNP